MRVGFFKRTISYLFDIIPIITILTLALNLFAGNIIKVAIHDDYFHLEEIYQENTSIYETTVNPVYDQYLAGEITYDEFLEFSEPVREDYLSNNIYLYNIVTVSYFISVVLYYLISINVVYYIYVLALKGNTLGRKLMHIQLVGKISWHSLLLREILWKQLFWIITLSAGIAVDLGLIAFTSKKRTLRDIFSQTYLTPEGVDYPF